MSVVPGIPPAPVSQPEPPARAAASNSRRSLRSARGPLLLTTGTGSVALDLASQRCDDQLHPTALSRRPGRHASERGVTIVGMRTLEDKKLKKDGRHALTMVVGVVRLLLPKPAQLAYAAASDRDGGSQDKKLPKKVGSRRRLEGEALQVADGWMSVSVRFLCPRFLTCEAREDANAKKTERGA